MFSIKLATPEQIPEAELYLDKKIKGLVMLMFEQTLTGAVEFNIGAGGGYIEAIKTDKPEMRYVVFASALNFLDLHGIHDVYINLKEYEEVCRTGGCKQLSFKRCETGPIEPKDGYLAKLDLRGYFTE